MIFPTWNCGVSRNGGQRGNHMASLASLRPWKKRTESHRGSKSTSRKWRLKYKCLRTTGCCLFLLELRAAKLGRFTLLITDPRASARNITLSEEALQTTYGQFLWNSRRIRQGLNRHKALLEGKVSDDCKWFENKVTTCYKPFVRYTVARGYNMIQWYRPVTSSWLTYSGPPKLHGPRAKLLLVDKALLIIDRSIIKTWTVEITR